MEVKIKGLDISYCIKDALQSLRDELNEGQVVIVIPDGMSPAEYYDHLKTVLLAFGVVK